MYDSKATSHKPQATMLQPPHQTRHDGKSVQRRRRVPIHVAATAATTCAIFANCAIAFSPSAPCFVHVATVATTPCIIPSSAPRSPSQSKHTCICIFAQQKQDTPEAKKSSPRTCVVERLDLGEQFNRWRLLQQLLEAEADAADVNEVLYRVMKSFLDIPRPRRIKDAKGFTRSNTSPLINGDKKKIIQSLLNFAAVDAEYENDSSIPLFADGTSCIAGSTSVLEAVEKLLPDPIEEEDAHKTCWDIVIEMYGRELVKSEEMERSEEWRARCAVARVLIHYDFLEAGIIEDGNAFSTAE